MDTKLFPPGIRVCPDAAETVKKFIVDAKLPASRFKTISAAITDDEVRSMLRAVAGLDGDASNISKADTNAATWGNDAKNWAEAIARVQEKAKRALETAEWNRAVDDNTGPCRSKT